MSLQCQKPDDSGGSTMLSLLKVGRLCPRGSGVQQGRKQASPKEQGSQ